MHDSMQLLKLYTPTLFECANRYKGTVARISTKYERRWASMTMSIKAKGAFEAMTCIFDLLWEASENKNAAREFLSFIDQTVWQALISTTGSACKQLENLVHPITLFGWASCYAATFATVAAMEDFPLDGLTIVEENRIDFSKVLGLSDNPHTKGKNNCYC